VPFFGSSKRFLGQQFVSIVLIFCSKYFDGKMRQFDNGVVNLFSIQYVIVVKIMAILAIPVSSPLMIGSAWNPVVVLAEEGVLTLR
jgi:hypothetical protein